MIWWVLHMMERDGGHAYVPTALDHATPYICGAIFLISFLISDRAQRRARNAR